MEQTGFSTQYTNNYYLEKNLAPGQYVPQTYAMYWCMVATGISRIFTRDELREFLFRLGLTLDSLKIIEKWFAYDKLFNFQYQDQYFVFSADDIFKHFGFESFDTNMNLADMALTPERLNGGIRNAFLLADLPYGIQIIKPQQMAEGIIQFATNESGALLSDQMIKNANIFADDVLKLAPENLFTNTNDAFKTKQVELEDRKLKYKLKVESLPVFSLELLTDQTINKCMAIMLVPEYIQKLKETPGAYKNEAQRLLYLAWLFANGLLWGDDYETHEAEGVIINHFDYAEEDGGFNLFQFYEEYNMPELEPFLKGVFFK